MKRCLFLCCSLAALATTSATAATASPASPAIPAAPGHTFQDLVSENFAAWDVNKDGSLTVPELDLAIASPRFQGEAAAAVVALKRGTKDKTASLTAVAITAQVDKMKQDPKSELGYEKLYTWALNRITTANRSLFATQPPQIDAIKQGKIGDCFCLAALRTVIQRDPQALGKMITPQAGDAHTVQIGSKTITVPRITDGEIAIGSSTQNGLWTLVYEKAVGISRMKSGTPDATPLNVATKGGSAGSMMSELTTHPITRWSCKTWREATPETQPTLLDDVRHQFTTAFAEKRLVTGGTSLLAKGKKGPPGILFNHGYAVLGYEPATDEVHLWNPHGNAFTPKGTPGLEHGYATQKGEFRVPLKDLVTFFGGFAFEQS